MEYTVTVREVIAGVPIRTCYCQCSTPNQTVAHDQFRKWYLAYVGPAWLVEITSKELV